MSPTTSSPVSGRLIATFRGRPIEPPIWVFVLLPGALLVAAIFIYGIYLAGTTYQQHGPALAIARSQAWILLATVLFILLAAFFFYRVMISLQRIHLYETGLKMRGFFFYSRSYSWEELSGISSSATRLTFFGKPISTQPAGKLYTAAGSSINISQGYQGIPKLIKIIKSKLYPMIWPQIQSAIRAGRAVRFGRITLQRDGMTISRRTIPWGSISRMYTDAGFLVVELRDNSDRKVPTISIPNLELLLESVNWGFQQ